MIVGSEAGLHRLTTVPVEALAADLDHLVSSVLNEHVNDSGLCAVCGCAFPCESAVLAEHNAGLL